MCDHPDRAGEMSFVNRVAAFYAVDLRAGGAGEAEEAGGGS